MLRKDGGVIVFLFRVTVSKTGGEVTNVPGHLVKPVIEQVVIR